MSTKSVEQYIERRMEKVKAGELRELHRKQAGKLYRKRRREKAVAAGLCEKCFKLPAAPDSKLCKACREKRRAYTRTYNRTARFDRRRLLKAQVIEHYGGKCVCCGFDQLDALTLDHIDGGGNQQHKEVGPHRMWAWLIKQGFPEGFQVLCANCQLSKTYRGRCMLKH